MQHSRRSVLRAGGALAAGALAGCTDRVQQAAADPGADGEGGFVAFFTLGEFAGAVGGDAMTFENPVPVGTMGHRWEPGSDLPPRIAASEAFVYLGVEGFQGWALDTAETLSEDHPDVALVDALEGVDLLDAVDDGHDHEDGTHEGDDGHDHDHGDDGFDPHFWVDPLRAAESVRTIRDRLVAADPDNADAYESNAADYAAELESLHAEFEAALADRTQEAVVVAGHNSYRYLADRYGFEVRSPVGVSPHAEPSQSEIADVVEFVDANGVEVVLADHFESEALAETIVRESSAEEIRRLSPAEGTTAEWEERGWGYVDQMREINLPALRAALGA